MARLASSAEVIPGFHKRKGAMISSTFPVLLPPPYLKPMVITAVYTRLRRGDILTLKWSNIALERGVIRLTEEKTGKPRTIVLNADMINLFHRLPVKGEYVFRNKQGKAFKDIKRSFEIALKEVEIKQGETRQDKIVFHTLRHTCISLLTDKGADTTMVKNYVAHASEEMTQQYAHLSEEYAKRTVEILNGLCNVSLARRNKMETTDRNAKEGQNASLATA